MNGNGHLPHLLRLLQSPAAPELQNAPLPPTATPSTLLDDLNACVSALHDLRLQLVNAEEDLRRARQAEELARAVAERSALTQAADSSFAQGRDCGFAPTAPANPCEGACRRLLTLALAADADYQAAARHAADATQRRDALRAEVQHQADLQSAARTAIHLTIVAAAVVQPPTL